MNRDSPYKGLDAFDESELDALLFFGREREREIVVANLIASRLTVLYGPTGVGKSSLLRAAVARSLRDLPEAPLVVVFDRWGGDPTEELAAAVAAALGNGSAGGLHETVERAQQSRDVYLILDQAEEYFVYHEGEDPFDEVLARLVAEPLRANVLLSLREDSLAKLDRFKPRIPAVYANSLRLDRLDRSAGRAAIVGPVGRWNELESDEVKVEPALVEAVLDGVGAGQIEQAAGGLGTVEGNGRPSTVEAPYLQLVMQRLWDVERAVGSTTLRAETLGGLGGARQVVADHLERAVESLTLEQREVAARLFTYLVTPSGTKIAHELPDLAEYAGVEEAEAAPVVETLSRHRILRPDEAGRTEIFHDVLAGEVLAWRRRHATESALERERDESRRRHRRLAWLAGGALLGFFLMSLLTVFALSQRSEARAQAKEAKAHQLEASAAARLPFDPELSMLLAREAARLAPSRSVEETLRNALLVSRVRTVIPVDEQLLGAVLHGRQILAAAADGSVVVADAANGRTLRRISSGKPALRASFAVDGTVLLTGRDGRLRLVSPSRRITTVPAVEDAQRAEISPDASLVVLIGERDARLVDVETGAVQQTFRHRGVVSAAISDDNRRVATGAADETIRLWARTGKLLRALLGHKGRAVVLAFGPNAASVASASTDGLGRIWQAADGRLSATIAGDATALTDIGFSTDGEHVVISSRDGTVRVSKADTSATLLVLQGHKDRVTSAAFSGPAGSSVITASFDGTARVWDALYQPELEELASFPAAVTGLEVDGDGRIHAATAGGRVYVLDPETGDTLGTESGGGRSRVVLGPDGMTATIRGTKVDLRADARVTTLEGHRDRVLAAAFSPDGSVLATASRDHDLRIWDAVTGDLRLILQHNSEVRDVAFSPDGRWIVTAAGRAALWDPQNGALVVRLQGHEGPFTATRFDSSGRVIVSGGIDGTVRTYGCEICGGLDELIALADQRLAATGRELTSEERERYLG